MSEEINKLKEYLQYRISELKDSKLFYCENDELKIVDAINGIVDLQQKVEQLEKENKELRDENKRIFQNVNDDELLISNAMNYAELKKTEKKVEQLENIRKEAIDYLKDWQSFPHTNCTTHNELKNLLNILNKGSEFNVKENNTNNN